MQPGRRVYDVWALRLTWACALGIAVGTLTPTDQLPNPSGSDKLHHFMAFALLVLPVAYAFPRKWGLIALAACAYGGAIELIQPYVGRSAEWLDFVADGAGVAAGLLLGLAARLLHRRFDSPQSPP